MVLGKEAFTTATKDNKTLKSLFEDQNITKYLWDVRNDADALWALYQVSLSGVVDVQLLENASRPDDRTYLRGLDVCVQHDLRLPYMESNRWRQTKREVKDLMSSKVFTTRPMDVKIIQYCSNDVVHLPALRDFYLGRIKNDWLVKAKGESGRRVIEAHSAAYQPISPDKKYGPSGSGGNKKTISLDQMAEMMYDEMLEDDFREDHDPFDYDFDDGNMAGEAPECMDECWDKY